MTPWLGLDRLFFLLIDPETNRCIFREYSRGNVLEGQVVLKDCNPLRAGKSGGEPAIPEGPRTSL